MLTVGVEEEVAPAVGKTFDQEGEGYHERHTASQGGKAKLGNSGVGEDGRIAQWVANSHIAIQSHKHEHARLHARQHVDEKHLYEAGIKVNLLEIEPKDT